MSKMYGISLLSIQFCMGNIKMIRFDKRLLTRRSISHSLKSTNLHEFGGPPVVPSKKFGCPFIKLHRRFKGICHCQIHMPVLVMYLLPNLLLKDESRKQVLDLKVCSKLLLPPKSTNLSSAQVHNILIRYWLGLKFQFQHSHSRGKQ